MAVFDGLRARCRTRAWALALLLVPFPATSQTLIGKFIKETSPPAPGHYYVSLNRATPEEQVESLARRLADEHGGRIRIIYTHGFRVEMSEENAIDLSRDPRVETVADYPIRGPEPDLHRFLKARTPGPNPREYTAWLVEMPARFDDARVKEISARLTAKYGGRVIEARALSIGRPHFRMTGTEDAARSIAHDKGVHHVEEADYSPMVSIEPEPFVREFDPLLPTCTGREYAQHTGLPVLDDLLQEGCWPVDLPRP